MGRSHNHDRQPAGADEVRPGPHAAEHAGSAAGGPAPAAETDAADADRTAGGPAHGSGEAGRAAARDAEGHVQHAGRQEVSLPPVSAVINGHTVHTCESVSAALCDPSIVVFISSTALVTRLREMRFLTRKKNILNKR